MSNPDLGDTFRGIERFLSTELVEATARSRSQTGIVQPVGGGVLEIQAQLKNQAKQHLARTCEARDNPADLERLIALIPWIEQQLPRGQPQASLPGM
jgi:hypothetical protein